MYKQENLKQETWQKETALTDYCDGFETDPSSLLQAAIEQTVVNMQDLPFFHAAVQCYCPKAVLFENQWITTIVAPWMISLVILPGPQQQWPIRELGEKLIVELPYKKLTFTVSGMAEIPQYLSCSLHSPLDKSLTNAQARQLAKDCLTMALSLPIKQHTENSLKNENRRHIFKNMLTN
ncbi:Tat proofreading chaperone HybE [Cricetibacter osteomyelitidis]|uniref:Tat proofreading chaperone HybE n=1 Tax=Cricetibacter osteomyelitidis TaxID=1521931 RepID=A0A4R2TIS3_9PAST|nr:hydrogenase-2 assembly chaperone [Cricetibacter osteomyelitidis]TCP94702.1 Tat proofreading chaperone HybE [Cricetibacter osteomyelitidis]